MEEMQAKGAEMIVTPGDYITIVTGLLNSMYMLDIKTT